MRLADSHRLAGLSLPVLVEGRVEILVQLAGRVVGDVEQRGLGKALPMTVSVAVNAASLTNPH
jgi:hypothetical protein